MRNFSGALPNILAMGVLSNTTIARPRILAESSAAGSVNRFLNQNPHWLAPFAQSGLTLGQQQALVDNLSRATDFDAASSDLARVFGVFNSHAFRAFGVCEAVCAWHLPDDRSKKRNETPPIAAFDKLTRSQWEKLDRLVRRVPEPTPMDRRGYYAYVARGDPTCRKPAREPRALARGGCHLPVRSREPGFITVRNPINS